MSSPLSDLLLPRTAAVVPGRLLPIWFRSINNCVVSREPSRAVPPTPHDRISCNTSNTILHICSYFRSLKEKHFGHNVSRVTPAATDKSNNNIIIIYNKNIIIMNQKKRNVNPQRRISRPSKAQQGHLPSTRSTLLV